jgi:hypothetical protein
MPMKNKAPLVYPMSEVRVRCAEKTNHYFKTCALGKHYWYDHDGAMADRFSLELGCNLASTLGDTSF